MKSLMEIYRMIGHRPFVCETTDRKLMRVLGVGPNKKFIGWQEGSDKVLELDADERNYQLRASF